ncbi:DUF2993 domain-containing protein [Sciscionella marina]|uniref:LmeA family phospholipid-binding protein n=1 Tax=Sciscionella marina TaxID=508770 RepID=UPI00036AF1DB|nr:DUF2993 domain-containing protein [Sciscionella marina]
MATQQEPRRRRRGLRRTIITVIVVLAVLVGADFGFGSYMEYRVSKLLRAQLHVQDDPRVSVHGFPFTTQALAGDYGNITVDANDVPATPTVHDLAFNINLRHVQVPIGQLASGEVDRIPVQELDGSVKVSAADIARMLHLSDIKLAKQPINAVLGNASPVSESNPDPDAFNNDPTHRDTRAGFSLTANTSLAGQRTAITIYGMITLQGGQIVATPKKLKLTNAFINSSLPDSISHQLLGRFAFRVDPGTLPFSVSPTRVGVTEDGALSVTGKARDVVLNGNLAR